MKKGKKNLMKSFKIIWLSSLAPNTDNQDKTNKINKKQRNTAIMMINKPKEANINMLSCKYDAHKTCFLKIWRMDSKRYNGTRFRKENAWCDDCNSNYFCNNNNKYLWFLTWGLDPLGCWHLYMLYHWPCWHFV